jgi:aryl-alcohol dehydrogenase-like predicted oxidoreductase
MWENKSPEIDPVCMKAYCGESNFKRLERAEQLAKEKGVTIPQIAMAFILCGPMNVFPIIGAANRQEMESSIGALNVKLTPQEILWLDLKTDER